MEEKTNETSVLHLNLQSSSLSKDPRNLDKSILLAIKSFRIYRTWEADQLIRCGLSLILHSVVFLNHNNTVINVVFSPDGKYISTASGDKTARLWTAKLWISNTGDLIKDASNRLTRNLNREKWKEYIVDKPYQKTFTNLP